MSADSHIVIVGPMGSGKTTMGRLLAIELGRPFLDSDEWIFERFGRTGREIAASEGVPALHAIEVEALEGALASERASVIAAAASVADQPRSRRLLASSFCVYLSASPEILEQRQALGAHRREVEERERMERRASMFEELADLIIDTGALSERAALNQVLAEVGVAGPSR